MVEVLIGFVEALLLVVFLDIGLDDPDAGDVLADGCVQVIVLFEDLVENPLGRARHEKDEDRDDDDRKEVDHGKLRGNGHGKDHGHNQGSRGPHAHADQHLEGVLQVRDIGRQPCNQGCRRKLVDILEGIPLNRLELGLAQVLRKARRSRSPVLAAHDAEKEAGSGTAGHDDSDLHYRIHVLAVDSVVDDPGHQQGDDHFDHDLTQHEDRGQDRVLPEAPDVAGQFFHNCH